MRDPHHAGCYRRKIIANEIGRFAESGQAGPCLTDAARSTALDAPFAKLPLRRDPNAPAAVIAAQIARGHNKPPVHQDALHPTAIPDTQELGKREANCQGASCRGGTGLLGFVGQRGWPASATDTAMMLTS